MHISSSKGLYVKPTSTEIDRRLDTLKASSTKSRSHHGEKIIHRRAPSVVEDTDDEIVVKKRRTTWPREYTALLAEIAANNLQENGGIDHDWNRVREVFLSDSSVNGPQVCPSILHHLNGMTATQLKRFHHSWVVCKGVSVSSSSVPLQMMTNLSESSSSESPMMEPQVPSTSYLPVTALESSLPVATTSIEASIPGKTTSAHFHLPISSIPYGTSIARSNCDISYEDVIAIPLEEANAITKYSDDEMAIITLLLNNRKCHKGLNSINWRMFHETYQYQAKLLKHRKTNAIVYNRSQSSLIEKVKSMKKK